MPVYEYSCTAGCESYEVWRSIEARSNDTSCPQCGSEGTRVFTAPMTICGPLRLKRETSEPRLVSKKSTAVEPGKARLRQSSTRPWMLNRGC